MNKDHKKQKYRPSFLVVVMLITGVTLLLSVIISIITPTKDRIVANDFVVNNFNDTQSTFKKVSFTGTKIVVPVNFNIYQSQNNSGLAEELVDKLIKEYGLQPDESTPNYWTGATNSLAKNNYEHYYIFSNQAEKKDNVLVIIADEAISVCQKFYSKYSLLLDLKPQKNSLLYLNTGLEQSIVSAKQATFLQIPLTYELDGYKVFYENQSDYPFFCRVNSNYELERVVFKDFFERFQALKEIPSISIDQAISNIKNGNASIIKANSKIVSAIDLNWINEAELYSVEIEYRYDGELKIAYPFYKFQTKLTNSAGINIEAELITPAVATAIDKK